MHSTDDTEIRLTVRAVADLDRRDAEAGNAMGVPEADTCCEQDGLVGGHLLEHLVDVCIRKARRGHDSVRRGFVQREARVL